MKRTMSGGLKNWAKVRDVVTSPKEGSKHSLMLHNTSLITQMFSSVKVSFPLVPVLRAPGLILLQDPDEAAVLFSSQLPSEWGPEATPPLNPTSAAQSCCAGSACLLAHARKCGQSRGRGTDGHDCQGFPTDWCCAAH